jgi:hypothetical protein
MKILAKAALTAAAVVVGTTAAVAGTIGMGVGALLGACACGGGRVSKRGREQANSSEPSPATGDAAPTVGT